MVTLVFLLFGLVLLTGGAELLVRGAASAANMLGVPSLIIGLTIVAYGTSAPELSVSVVSGMQGKADVALGNVVGSNIFNVLFILGLSALISPLVISSQLIRMDVPIMIGVSALVLLMSLDSRIGRIDGLVLVAVLIGYTFCLFYFSRNQAVADGMDGRVNQQVNVFSVPKLMMNIIFILAGLGLLVWGSNWLVDAAVTIAMYFGIPELIIGLTIISIGTSLPEVATSVTASLRGERDIAAGNVIGSNLFNLMGVLGITAAVSSTGVPVPEAAVSFDIPVMTAVAVACLPVFFTGSLISRWEGTMFLGFYVAYTLFLLLSITNHSYLHEFSAAMFIFVIPLTVITLITFSLRQLINKA